MTASVGALDRVGRRRDPGLLEVGAGELGAAHRLGRLAEALELAQLGRVVAHEARRQRLVLAEREPLAGLADLVGDLLAALDEVGEDLGGVAGQAGQRVSEVKIAHAAGLRPAQARLLACKISLRVIGCRPAACELAADRRQAGTARRSAGASPTPSQRAP